MNIDQLPNGLRELAEKRACEEVDTSFKNKNLLINAFSWWNAKEGQSFWESINYEEYYVYTNRFPAHDWIEDYPNEYDIIYDPYGNKLLRKVDDAARAFTPAVLANGYYAGEDQPQEVRDAWVKGYEYACRNINLSDLMYVPSDGLSNNPPDVVYVETTGIKENQGKLSYEEIDFNFIDLMAVSMAKNKDKYPPFNWHKPIKKMDLVDAILRHTRKVKQPIEGDVETDEEHLVNIACNSMMLWFQYVNHK